MSRVTDKTKLALSKTSHVLNEFSRVFVQKAAGWKQNPPPFGCNPVPFAHKPPLGHRGLVLVSINKIFEVANKTKQNLHLTVIQGADKKVLPSLSHQFDIPFFIWKVATIMFAIAPQIPLLDNFPLTKRKLAILFRKDKQMLMSTKLTMADLFTFLLRLTTAPSTCWSLFFTFTHK